MSGSDSLFPTATIQSFPVLALRNMVLFPSAVVPVNVGRLRSIRAVEHAYRTPKRLILTVCQRDSSVDDPGRAALFDVGTVARILKVIRLSTGTYSVVLQGVCRAKLGDLEQVDPHLAVPAERMPPATSAGDDIEVEALVAQMRAGMRALTTRMPPSYSEQSEQALARISEPGALADVVAAYLPSDAQGKQRVLETTGVRERLRTVLELIRRESDLARVKQEVTHLVEAGIPDTQREQILRQQLKDIRRQLGEDDSEESELESLREKLLRAQAPADVVKAAKRQLSRMHSIPPASPEYQLAKSYVQWLADLPWSKMSEDKLDVAEARAVLDADHHGLEKVKKRITELIAVRSLKPNMRGPILCLVGPPGVGKTSLAKSIAKATDRSFARVSLGGVHDEGEIRGHRRTYVGAFPGRIIAAMKRAATRNPVIVLDEVDKLVDAGSGSPSAALLEVLDPAQNDTFVDHYLEVSFDLSQVLFIATANTTRTIPQPLLDRMEVIEIPGYTFPEKLDIARDFVIPRVLSEHGQTPEQVIIDDDILRFVVEGYSREPGVRQLSQHFAALARHAAVQIAADPAFALTLDEELVRKVLGSEHPPRQAESKPLAGVAMGVGLTGRGGELIPVEASLMDGKGQVHVTGSMGDITKESVAAAFSFIRSHAEQYGLPPDFLSRIDVHIHLPNGAAAKDGPSFGVASFLALLSMLTRQRVRHDRAFLGEVTLRGQVLPVAGLRERLLGAYTAGVRDVVMPSRNAHELVELPDAVLEAMTIRQISRLGEAVELAILS